jgi:NADP-dependent 3-hydroxy acid dehydrogenase YdfG
MVLTIQNGNLDWDAMIDNVSKDFYMFQSCDSGMIERKSGHIINIGSIARKEVYQMEMYIAPLNTLMH